MPYAVLNFQPDPSSIQHLKSFFGPYGVTNLLIAVPPASVVVTETPSRQICDFHLVFPNHLVHTPNPAYADCLECNHRDLRLNHLLFYSYSLIDVRHVLALQKGPNWLLHPCCKLHTWAGLVELHRVAFQGDMSCLQIHGVDYVACSLSSVNRIHHRSKHVAK